MLRSFVWFVVAALGEIGGCYAFWLWARLGRSPLWIVAGLASLTAFAMVLTRVDSDLAGRAYAAYGGIYIVGAVLWMWNVEGQRPDRWDLIGAVVCLAGSALILLGPRVRQGG